MLDLTTFAIHLCAVEMQVKCYLQHIYAQSQIMFTDLLHICINIKLTTIFV